MRLEEPARPVDQLHHERRSAARFLDPVDLGEVGVIQCRERLCLALEAPKKAADLERRVTEICRAKLGRRANELRRLMRVSGIA
jgi:hypothetical protein